MTTFGQRLAAVQRTGLYKRVDNAHTGTEAKVLLRRKVLAEIGPENAHVFDAYAGAGTMFHRVWREAASYVGCDEKYYPDERAAYVADNRRVMRAIDLSAFNVFDFDAYGSPWEQILVLAERRPMATGERIGIVLTDGSGMRLKMAHIPNGLAKITGLRRKMLGAGRFHGEIIDRALNGMCLLLGARPVRRWQAKGKTGAKVMYVGIILEGE